MRELSRTSGIDLRLLYGDPTREEALRNDSGRLAWAEYLPTRHFLNGQVFWQPFMARAKGSDLVVMPHENRQINNLAALLTPRHDTKLAFWGHGRNMQSEKPDGLRERLKRWTARQVDWWFAYTELSATFVREIGFPPDRITVLNNSIDTHELRSTLDQIQTIPRERLRASLGLGDGSLAVYLGSLYEAKRLDFLVEVARAVHSRIPAFELAIAGDGPSRTFVEQAASASPFIKYLGSVRGDRKAQLLATGDIVLNPGMVGLAILDAFVAGLPLLTTNCRIHSPEIAYLRNGHNGLMTEDSIDEFTRATVSILQDREYLQRLRDGALQAGRDYSIEHMAERFCSGISSCLSSGAAPTH